MSHLSFQRPLAFAIVSLLLSGCGNEKSVEADLSPMTDGQAKAFSNLHGCNACHAIDEMRLGPPFRAVSQMYDDDSQQTVERLALKIRFGGAGSWGNVPMVAKPELSDEDSRRIARWILSLPTDVDKAASAGGSDRSSGTGQQ